MKHTNRPHVDQYATDAIEDTDRWDAAFDAAREFIRCRCEEDGCVVGIGEILEHLDEVFGKAAGLTADVGTVLTLVSELWADPQIDRVPGDWIDFFWRGAARGAREGSSALGLRSYLSGGPDAGVPR